MAGKLLEGKTKPKKPSWEEDGIPSAHLCSRSSGAHVQKLVFLSYGWGQTLPAAYAEQAGEIALSLISAAQTRLNAMSDA